MRPPPDQIPVVVPVNRVLARTAEVALAITAVDAYTTGLTIRLAVRLRTPPASIRRISQIVTGYVDPNGHPDDRLVLTVGFADGRMATLGGAAESMSDRGAPTLHPSGGGGGDRAHDLGCWLSALPPAGDLVLTCTCAPLRIPPTRTILDGAAFARAGASATVLWSE